MSEQNKRPVKVITIRTENDLIKGLKEKSEEHRMSLNSYIKSVLKSEIQKKEQIYKEWINKPEKKEIESRVFFTKSESKVLREYAVSNGWSLSREVRYRVISTISKKPKLSGKELEAIYSVRSSINVLGANINRLIRNNKALTNENIEICKNLVELLKEIKDKISYLERCNHSNFKIENGDKLGGG